MTLDKRIKDLLKEFRPTSQKTNRYNPNIQENCFRYFTFNKDGIKIKAFIFSTKILLEIKVNTSLLFAVNIPDIICTANKALNKQIEGHKIYTNNSNDSLIITCINLIENEIKDLRLKENEGLFVYNNVLHLAIYQQRELVPEINSLIKLKSKIEQPEIKSEIAFSNLPNDLQDLIPFLEKWALSDDDEREQKINQSSKIELAKVIDVVNPKMNIINNYLDSFKEEALPSEAILIGNLAELVTEITLLK
jgi:hypothetical protein